MNKLQIRNKQIKIFKLILLSPLFSGLFACGNGGITQSTTNNTVPLVVDGGYNGNGTNKSYITIQVCQPGTNNCQTIDHVIVDSGSVALNINASQLNLSLPAIKYNNNPLYRCSVYGAGYNFSSMVTADIRIAGELAANIPLGVFQNSGPESCSNGLPVVNLAEVLGAKAILGIGVVNPSNSLVYPGLYTCNGSNCTPTGTNINIQTPLVINIASAFATDNNGVIFKLPAVSGVSNTPITGTLTFGINTQANNIVPQSVHVVNGNPNSYSSGVPLVGYFYSNDGFENIPAIFDSGTPSVQFYSPTFAQCTGALDGIYCPNPSPQNWSSTVSSYNGNENFPITMSIVNYSALTSIPAILPGLGQVHPFGTFTSYGLTFFYGKTIYARFATGNSIDTSLPMATGPAWGFTSNQ